MKIKEFRSFLFQELSSMKDNVCDNYGQNIENRKNNPFLPITNANAKKYMALSRSIDSQLGNRIQRIIFFLARERYSDIGVPNVIHLKYFDKSKEMVITLYSAPIKLPKQYQNIGYDPFQQYIYVDKDIDEKIFKKLFKIKSNSKAFQKLEIKVNNCSKTTLTKYEENKGKRISIDLLTLCFNNEESIDALNIYEIKMGGNLDTKNAPSNANEVLNNKVLFSFIENVQSYFATCYGKCSTSVAKAICENGCELLSPESLWKNILPDKLTYYDFISEYTKAFKKSRIENTIKKL